MSKSNKEQTRESKMTETTRNIENTELEYIQHIQWTTQHLKKEDRDNIYARGIDGSGNRWGTQLQTINITRQSRLNTRQRG